MPKSKKKQAAAKADPYIKVNYKPEGGPVILEVSAGFASIGEFILAYCPVNGFEYKEWGKDPKRIDDNINDLFVVPFDLQQLDQFIVFIIGKYAPSPGHLQVRVNYVFTQDGKELYSTTIEEEVTNDFKRYTHEYKFIKV